MLAFFSEMLIEDPDGWVPVQKLYDDCERWCDDHSVAAPDSARVMGKALRAVVPKVTRERNPQENTAGKREYSYHGIRYRAGIEQVAKTKAQAKDHKK